LVAAGVWWFCVASGGAPKLEELLVEETWAEALDGELTKPYALELCRFVTHERLHGPLPIYPPPHLVFHALNATPFDRVKAVIIGQVPPAPPPTLLYPGTDPAS
jgi:uracil-DNA glycosylase